MSSVCRLWVPVTAGGSAFLFPQQYHPSRVSEEQWSLRVLQAGSEWPHGDGGPVRGLLGPPEMVSAASMSQPW